jgi:hypothetical protein
MAGEEQHSPNTSQTSLLSRFWTFLRILIVRLRFIFLMVIVGVVVGYWENITNYYDHWRRSAVAWREPAIQRLPQATWAT